MSVWINVKDRLPEPGTYVLTYGEGAHYLDRYIVCSLTDDRVWCDVDYYDVSSITHWMPLPDAPTIVPKKLYMLDDQGVKVEVPKTITGEYVKFYVTTEHGHIMEIPYTQDMLMQPVPMQVGSQHTMMYNAKKGCFEVIK